MWCLRFIHVVLYHIVLIICLLTPHILHFTAPTDTAFAKLEQDNREFYEKLQVDTDLLTKVLKGHVVNGAVMSTDLSNNQEVKPLNEEMPFIVNKGDNGSTNGILLITEGNTDAVDVIAANIKACNGYVHVIDQVLLPPPADEPDCPGETGTIVDVAVAQKPGEFNTLVQLVLAADGLVEYLSNPENESTVFGE